MSSPDNEERSISILRQAVLWFAAGGTIIWAGFFFLFLAYHSMAGTKARENWFLSMVQEHSAATIGIGISAVTAFLLVALMETTRGPIEFEAIGFRFKGASGPVVMWVFCFLALVFSVWLLWNPD